MQGHILVLPGGRGHTGYTYALAQMLHEKASLPFLASEGDATKKL